MDRVNRRAAGAWLIITLVMVVGALAPFQFHESRSAVLYKIARIRLNPLFSPETGRRVSIPDVGQNVLFFAPFGALAMLSLRRGRRRRAIVLARVAVAAAIMSAAIEAAQLFTRTRTTSLTDVIANTLGAVAAAAVCARLLEWIDDHPHTATTIRTLTAVPGFTNVAVVVGLLCTATWQPFDATLDLHTMRMQFEALRSYQPLSSGDALGDAARGVLFGFVAADWLAELRVAHATRWAALGSVVAVLLLQATQILIESRVPRIFEAAIVVPGAIAGAACAPYVTARTPRKWLGGALAVCSVGALTLLVRASAPRAPMAELTRALELNILAAQAVICVAVFSRRFTRIHNVARGFISSAR